MDVLRPSLSCAEATLVSNSTSRNGLWVHNGLWVRIVGVDDPTDAGVTMAKLTTSPASEIFEQALPGIEAGDLADLLERCTDDVVFEFPFAPAERPGRVEGRDAVREYLGPIFARTQTQGLSDLVIHQTVDAAVAVIEFTATAQIGGGPAREMSYVVVLTVRGSQIARYRDYWNPLALAGEASRS